MHGKLREENWLCGDMALAIYYFSLLDIEKDGREIQEVIKKKYEVLYPRHKWKEFFFERERRWKVFLKTHSPRLVGPRNLETLVSNSFFQIPWAKHEK